MSRVLNRNSRSLLRGWSLEAKCLFALGLALAISFAFAMYLMHWIADQLVRETMRAPAPYIADLAIMKFHSAKLTQEELQQLEGQVGQTGTAEFSDTLRSPAWINSREELLDLSKFNLTVLRVDDDKQWQNLGGTIPADTTDLTKIYELESQLPPAYRVKPLSNHEKGVEPSDNNSNVQPDNQAAVPRPTNPLTSETIFEDYGPVGASYYYYHPIRFPNACMNCHSLKESTSLASNSNGIDLQSLRPFRALRIEIPIQATRLWTIWIYSSMIAVAVATLSVALFLVHRILKRLVIRPLKYLRDVTDQVADGNTDIRSTIATRDEFQAVSDSLNHMLRHLIDAQSNMEQANLKLVEQVDKMAQVNLELFEANRLKSEFLANMSHELRTPLNSILGFSDVLQGIDSLTDKQKKYASNIQRSGRTLLDMINDILDLAKIEAGKMQLQCSEFNIANVVREQCESIRSLSDEKNIDVRINVLSDNAEESTTVFQDKVKLQQILNNLLSNAIKFTPEGGFVTVELDLIAEDQILVSFMDTGVGIAEADRDVIFEKFRQVPNHESADSLTRETTGTGLGLSITRELCKLLGGDISVESEVGKGSTFVVELARRLPQPNAN